MKVAELLRNARPCSGRAFDHTHPFHPENWRGCDLRILDKKKLAFVWAQREFATSVETNFVASVMHNDDLSPGERRKLSRMVVRLINEFGRTGLNEDPAYDFHQAAWRLPEYNTPTGHADDIDLDQLAFDHEHGLTI